LTNAQAGTVKVVVGMKEFGELRPGLWVDVELVLDSKSDAVLLPKRSIIYDNDQTYAFKAYTDTNGVLRAKRELVVPLNTDKVHIEPAAGFVVGDRIIVAGQSGLKEGSPIRETNNPANSDSTGSVNRAPPESHSPSTTKASNAQGAN